MKLISTLALVTPLALSAPITHEQRAEVAQAKAAAHAAQQRTDVKLAVMLCKAHPGERGCVTQALEMLEGYKSNIVKLHEMDKLHLDLTSPSEQ